MNDRDRGVLTRASFGEAITLASVSGSTATADVTAVTNEHLQEASALLIVLNVTAQSGTSPTLDVEVQASVGGLYHEFVQFAQRGATTTKTMLNVKRGIVFTTELTLAADPAVAGTTAVVNNIDWMDTLRVTYAIGGSDTPTYSFTVTAYPIYY